MPIPRHSLAALVGVAVLVLLLPACSAPAIAPVDRVVSGEEEAKAANEVAIDGIPDEADKPGQGALPEEAGAGGDPMRDDAEGFWGRFDADVELAKDDYRSFCSVRGLSGLALGIGLAAPLADTHADIAVRDWYQSKVRSSAANRAADVLTYAGQLWVVVPVGVETAALLGEADTDDRTDGGLCEWSNRCLRGIAVGYPPTVALFAVLGSSRPDRHDSRWHPFADVHGVSGHTFLGAVPFLTAAAMTDDELLKGSLFLGSFLTGWARLNNDRHYLSQVALGWWMACLAVTNVDETQWQRRAWSLAPTWVADGPGVAVQFQY
jgi:hypothetical protein